MKVSSSMYPPTAEKFIARLFFCLILFGLAGCDLSMAPYDGKAFEKALDSVEDLKAATRGNYSLLRGYITSAFLINEFPSDNVMVSVSTVSDYRLLYNYNHTPNMGYISGIWPAAYRLAYNANQVIEHIEEGQSAELDQLKGENLFLRALAHFQLARIFARPYSQGRDNLGIPIADSTGMVDKLPSRSTVGEVYDFIVADLKKAAELMAIPKSNVYASREAAWALLSRVYLYMGENEKAIEYANKVINAGRYELMSTEAFKDYSTRPPEENPEIIFAVKFTESTNAGWSSLCSFYYTSEGGTGWGEVFASKSYRKLLDQYPEDVRHAFIEPQYVRDESGEIVRDENGDPVLQEENGYPIYYVDKFCGQNGIPMLASLPVLRLAEMYLNRAEAYAKLGMYEKAIADVNRIRRRAGLSGDALYSVGDLKGHDTVLDVVLEERRLELAFEGHRKYDLFRNGRPLVRTYPGKHLNPSNPGVNMAAGTQVIPPDHPRVVFYIPESDIELNPNLTQNP